MERSRSGMPWKKTSRSIDSSLQCLENGVLCLYQMEGIMEYTYDENIFSDLYKDAFGFRPQGHHFYDADPDTG